MCTIHADTGRHVCNVAADLLNCQLCPQSPTYWQRTSRPASNTPWDGTGETVIAENLLPEQLPLVEWGSKGPLDAATRVNPPRPCARCGKPCNLLSPPTPNYPKGRVIHKVCVEAILTAQRNRS